MREEQPVYWNERYGFWALSRLEDVWTGYHDTETFRSTHGVQPEALDKPAGLLEAEINDGGGARPPHHPAAPALLLLLAPARRPAERLSRNAAGPIRRRLAPP